MKKVDVWFCRYEGNLYAVSTWADQEPSKVPHKAKSVKDMLDRCKRRYEIAQVGILPPEMMGLDIEV